MIIIINYNTSIIRRKVETRGNRNSYFFSIEFFRFLNNKYKTYYYDYD